MKKIVVCTDLNQESIDALKKLKSVIDLKHTHVDFIHVFEIRMYNADLVPVIYPTEDLYPSIEKSALGILNNLSNDLGLRVEQSTQHCFFSYSREERIKSFLEQTHCDLVVVATRGKHGIAGFFSSSLADFLCKYSPCSVLVLRP